MLRRLTHSGLPILFTGETGTGKEAFARAFHREGPRAAKPFVAVNCAALPESLIEAELFGYRPGAFTGANPKGARGKVLAADGGVLFLDEIGDMPLASQTRLLRVLAEGEVTPLGDGAPVGVDIQVVCATHQDLAEEVRGRALPRRPALPPERGDLPPAAAARPARPGGADREHASRGSAPNAGWTAALSGEATQALMAHGWPGNMRELTNVLTYAAAVAGGGPDRPRPSAARTGPVRKRRQRRRG